MEQVKGLIIIRMKCQNEKRGRVCVCVCGLKWTGEIRIEKEMNNRKE